MDNTEAMAVLDGIVKDRHEDGQYAAARALSEAVRLGLIDTDIPERTLYSWQLKWAFLPGTRGQRDAK